jgi:hypothetical protein
MRPNGFGGMAVLITAEAIHGKSTLDVLEDFLAQGEGNAAGNGGPCDRVATRWLGRLMVAACSLLRSLRM